jgi:hypothetical protein
MADDKIEVSYSERARKQLEELKKRSEKKPWGLTRRSTTR